ncbi:MAG: hypothetical protein K2Q26_13780 [Bdellovibrionales bacterium]|nr:hypothetical protein [Bdellovibrionales bacterium]
MKFITILGVLLMSTLAIADAEDCVREIVDNNIYETYTNECVCGSPTPKSEVDLLFEGVEDVECYRSLSQDAKKQIQAEKEAHAKACYETLNQSCGGGKKSIN